MLKRTIIRFIQIHILITTILLSGCSTDVSSQSESSPKLLLSAKGIEGFRSQLGSNTLVDETFNQLKTSVDAKMLKPIDVPIPKDPGGGYTHETHKKNGMLIYEAGVLYQLTGEEKYAEFVTRIFQKYAQIYPTLGLHPERKEQTPGKLFWQGLNECVWLVYSIQGYDLVQDYLTDADKKTIEEGVIIPMATFLSDGSAYTFNRIHNHGTWAVAAVGMTGYVLQDQDMVAKSLRGLDKSGKGGFLAQLDNLFSPDGYYTEGPYYQRYAMMPFIVFAEAIQKNDPDLHIFAYNDSILKKAVETSFQLTYTNGAFFPLNDAIKDKTLETIEMVYAANIAYAEYGQEHGLIDITNLQKRITFTDAGMQMAADWNNGLAEPYNWRSLFLSDGNRGDKGGVGILRSGSNNDQSCLLMKASSHGLGHGHFDKLGLLYYNNGTEIIRDYGAARFLNIEAKYGGRYLPENRTWAKQSIAHNTITIDETCQFEGVYARSAKHNPERKLFSTKDTDLQYMSALDINAYPGAAMHRTMIMVNIPSLEHPVVVDIFQVTSDKAHQLDLPYYYNGQLIETSFPTNMETTQINVLGKDHGYEHLWMNGSGKPDKGFAQTTWMVNNRFYTLSMLTNKNTEILFTTIGANDPNYNLRNESAIMLRQNDTKNHLFLNIIEPHGSFDPVAELTKKASSQIETLVVTKNTEKELVFEMTLKNAEKWVFSVPGFNDKNAESKVNYKQIKK